MAENPLVEDRFPVPFDQIRPQHVEPAIDALLADAEARLEALRTATDPPTFDNTMLAYEQVAAQLHRAFHLVSHLEGVATTEALREAHNAAQPRVQRFDSKLPLDEGLWARISAYATSDEAKGLTGARRRFLDQTLRFFRRHGADLPAAGKRRLEEIDVELGKLTLRYAQNTLDATSAFELYVEEDRLAGLPERAKRAAAEAAREKGKPGHRLSLQAPSFVPAITYLEDGALRETLYRAMSSRATSGSFDNRPLVARILELRREKATLLGYPSFVDLVLEERLAKSAAEAQRFVDDLERRTRAAFEREKHELLAFRRDIEGPDAPPLAPWDVAFYAEKFRKARYRFDGEMLRPYFAFEAVVAGIFELAERLFGVRFSPDREAPGWHPDVRAYKLVDADESWLATVYVDPYPRDDKRDGAWMNPILGRGAIEPDRRHAAVLIANVTPPVAGQPALLSHRDVETLFHEAGHLLHHCLSRAELPSHAGTNVAWDFVELPSQIMENWCWERESLDLFARHVETGAPIDDALLEAMRRARTFRAATAQMRQLGFASTDLALHTKYDPAVDGDVIDYARRQMEAFSPTPLPEGYAMIASFDHLFADPVGYAGAYYSYKWAEVLDADAFTRFRDAGLLDREVGAEFRQRILERGDEEDPAMLFAAFMGREPRLDAHLARLER